MSEEESYGVIPFHTDERGKLSVCVVRHAQGHWAFPKGHAEKEETPKETALRELKEETGITTITLNDTPLEEAYTFPRADEVVHKKVFYFIGDVPSKTPDTVRTHAEEIPEVRWVAVDKADSLLTYDSAKETLSRAVHYKED